jgi:hypothetical protein
VLGCGALAARVYPNALRIHVLIGTQPQANMRGLDRAPHDPNKLSSPNRSRSVSSLSLASRVFLASYLRR